MLQRQQQQQQQQQLIPDPLPSIPLPGRKPSLLTPPLPLPDYEYYNDCPDEVDDCEVIAYGSEHEEGERERKDRLRRIHTHALRYLAGERVYIHSAQLRGPIVGNPWGRKNKADTVAMAGNKGKEGERERLTKRRKLWEDQDDREIMATPTQRQEVLQQPVEQSGCAAMPQEKKGAGRTSKTVAAQKDNSAELPELTTRARGKRTASRSIDTSTKVVAKKGQATITKSQPSRIATIRKKTSDVDKDIKVQVKTASTKRTRATKSTSNKRPVGIQTKHNGASSAQRSRRSHTDSGAKEVEKGGTPERDTILTQTKETPMNQTLITPTLESEAAGQKLTAECTTHVQSGEEYAREEIRLSATSAARIPTKSPAPATPYDVEQHDYPPGNDTINPAFLRITDVTPPSIFYGTKSKKTSNTGASSIAVNKLSAVRQVESEPVTKPLPKAKSTSKSKRSISAPTQMEVSTKVNTSKSAKAISTSAATAKAGSKRKAGVSVDRDQSPERVGRKNNNDEWIPTSAGFRYKKVTGQGAALTTKNITSDGEYKQIDDTIAKDSVKGKKNEKEARPPNPKKARVVDFAALSPFGGGQVVSRTGKVYVSPERVNGSVLEKRTGTMPGKIDTDKAMQAGDDNPSLDHMIPLEPTVPVATIEGSPLREIAGNVNSQEDRALPNRIADGAHGAENREDNMANIARNTLGEVLKSTIRKTPRSSSSNLPAMAIPPPSTAPPVLQSPSKLEAATKIIFDGNSGWHSSSQPQSTFSQQLVILGPQQPSSREVQSQDSPYYNTQRQLSAAKRGFMSILDTPISDKSLAANPCLNPRTTLDSLDRAKSKLRNQVEETNASPLVRVPPRTLLPETPADGVRFDNDLQLSMEEGGTSHLEYVPGTSPADIAIEPRQVDQTTPATGFRTPDGGNLTLSSSMTYRFGHSREQQTNKTPSNKRNAGLPPPDLSPFKTFDTPTKSQFGNCMHGFSPLRYSPPSSPFHRPLDISPSQSQGESHEQSLPTFDKGEKGDHDDGLPRSHGKENHQSRLDDRESDKSRSSIWLGIDRTARISLFNSSPEAPIHRDSSSPPIAQHSSAQLRASSPIRLPPSPDIQLPKTPVPHKHSWPAPGEQSPGTRLAGDMLELMGGGVWDIEDELRKIEKTDEREEPTSTVKKMNGSLTGRGVFSRGTKRLGNGGGRW